MNPFMCFMLQLDAVSKQVSLFNLCSTIGIIKASGIAWLVQSVQLHSLSRCLRFRLQPPAFNGFAAFLHSCTSTEPHFDLMDEIGAGTCLFTERRQDSSSDKWKSTAVFQ